jgi:osmotically-inducible protein OsmY
MGKRLRFMTELIKPLCVEPGTEVKLSRDHNPRYTGQATRPQATALLADGSALLADVGRRLTSLLERVMCPCPAGPQSEERSETRGQEGELMKSDTEIRDDIIDELQWDPQITNPDAIGVAVTDGAVTLTGQVSTYAERLSAARAAERVYGVKAVANELKVRLSGAPRDDSDIARAIAHALEWNVQVPEGNVQVRVSSGWVTLDGEVEYEYQRHEVERMVRNVTGVVGVTDLITVKPPVSREKIQAVIEDAFKREAEIDARHVRVEVSDHTAQLYGHVHSLHEAAAARAAAASAPGVATVESHLLVSP